MAAKWIPDNQLKGMNSNRTCSATKYCHIYCWACCHCRFKDFEALFLPIEHSHTNFLFVCKFYTGVFWSRMEQKEGKTSMIFAFGPTNISMWIGTIVNINFKTLKPFTLQFLRKFPLRLEGLHECILIKDETKRKPLAQRQTLFWIILITPCTLAKFSAFVPPPSPKYLNRRQ